MDKIQIQDEYNEPFFFSCLDVEIGIRLKRDLDRIFFLFVILLSYLVKDKPKKKIYVQLSLKSFFLYIIKL